MRRTVYGVAASTRPCSLTLAEYREGELADGRASVRTLSNGAFADPYSTSLPVILGWES